VCIFWYNSKKKGATHMAKKLTTEERLQKLAEETKRLQTELKKKKKKDTDELHRLLGKALVSYFKHNAKEKEETEEKVISDLVGFARANLSEKERKRAERLIESKPFKMY